MTQSGSRKEMSPSELIDRRIEELGDWRGDTLGRLRALVKEADPEVVEEKWRGVPVWSHDGMVCTGESYKDVVKMTFARERRWPIRLVCSTRASKGTHDGPSTSARAKINEKALKELVRAAVALNESKGKR